mgnify:CR=1 FL=1
MTVYAINLSKVADPAVKAAFLALLLLLQQIGNSTLGVSGASFADVEVPTGTINGVNDTFTLSYIPNPAASLMLFKNGVFQTSGTDYNLAGLTITYVAGTIPQTGDAHVCSYRH